jgi:hypothetical protein
VVSAADPLRRNSRFYRPERGLVPEDMSICTDKQYEIAGITSGAIKTLGSVNLTLYGLTYRYQVAPEETELTEDGLVGRDIHCREGYVDTSEYRYKLGSEECPAHPFETGNRDDCSWYGLFG